MWSNDCRPGVQRLMTVVRNLARLGEHASLVALNVRDPFFNPLGTIFIIDCDRSAASSDCRPGI